MPYEGVAVQIEAYRLDMQIEDTQRDAIAKQQRELEAVRKQVALLEQDQPLQSNRIKLQQELITTHEKTIEELRGQLATLYKISQKPRFKVPPWVGLTVGAALGAYGTYRVMR